MTFKPSTHVSTHNKPLQQMHKATNASKYSETLHTTGTTTHTYIQKTSPNAQIHTSDAHVHTQQLIDRANSETLSNTTQQQKA